MQRVIDLNYPDEGIPDKAQLSFLELRAVIN
jgi:hypothetical protein